MLLLSLIKFVLIYVKIYDGFRLEISFSQYAFVAHYNGIRSVLTGPIVMRLYL